MQIILKKKNTTEKKTVEENAFGFSIFIYVFIFQQTQSATIQKNNLIERNTFYLFAIIIIIINVLFHNKIPFQIAKTKRILRPFGNLFINLLHGTS